VAFEFEAVLVVPDAKQESLSFADRLEHYQHYLIIQRDQEARDDILPDVENVYVERDDQKFGGYGGIESVLLGKRRLTLTLTPRMATRMGGHDTLSVMFAQDWLQQVDELTGLIFRGYESRVVRVE